MPHDHQHKLHITHILPPEPHLHHHHIDTILLNPEDLPRRRLQLESAEGRLVQIALPREQQLHDGALLWLDAHLALQVRVAAQHHLVLTPNTKADALALGYHAGNLHWKIEFTGASIRVALPGDPSLYLERLASAGMANRFTWQLA